MAPDLIPQDRKRESSSPRAPAAPRQNLRTNLRFRVEEAGAKLYVKGLLTSLGLSGSNKGRAALNVSEGGAMLLANKKLAIGTRVQLTIEMEKYQDSIETDGTVRWCFQSARNSKEYYAGIKFSGMDPLTVKKIAQMRDWFTSAEYKSRTSTRKKNSRPDISFPS